MSTNMRGLLCEGVMIYFNDDTDLLYKITILSSVVYL